MIRTLINNVKYIGADDTDLDVFEGQYIIPDGVSYNSYVILDEKVAVMDTVDLRKADLWKQQLAETLDGRQPDYLVVHHLEPDHAGLIGWVLEEYPSLQLVAGARAIQMLPQFFEDIALEGRTVTVKEGDTLSLGQHVLQFVAAPMVHWPEVMMSFDHLDGTLYSADAFGKFGALAKCGFYGGEDDDWSREARRYYFNIVGKYGAQVQAVLGKAARLPIRHIRPLHGPLLEENLGQYLDLYNIWSRYEVETKGIFIAVASIHGGTMAAAKQLAALLREKGAKRVVVSDLCRSDIAKNVEDAFRHDRMVVAASSYDGGLFTPMYDFLHRLQIKGYCKRRVAILENGSWAPSAGRVMQEMLGAMKDIDLISPTVTIRSRLKQSDLPVLDNLAGQLV